MREGKHIQADIIILLTFFIFTPLIGGMLVIWWAILENERMKGFVHNENKRDEESRIWKTYVTNPRALKIGLMVSVIIGFLLIGVGGIFLTLWVAPEQNPMRFVIRILLGITIGPYLLHRSFNSHYQEYMVDQTSESEKEQEK